MSEHVLRILTLYPEQLGVSGDRGNAMTLAERARRAGIESEQLEYRVGDTVPGDVDVVLLGHGPLSGVRSVSDDAQRLREPLERLADADVPLLAVGGGLELTTRGVVTTEGETVQGIGYFDALVRRGATRRTNYFRVTTPYGGSEIELFGFEDHASSLELGSTARPFGHVVYGGGNGSDSAEGVVRGASIGTQMKGPILPLNPALADRLLVAALSRHGVTYETSEAHSTLDDYAAASQKVIADNLDRAFKAM